MEEIMLIRFGLRSLACIAAIAALYTGLDAWENKEFLHWTTNYILVLATIVVGLFGGFLFREIQILSKPKAK